MDIYYSKIFNYSNILVRCFSCFLYANYLQKKQIKLFNKRGSMWVYVYRLRKKRLKNTVFMGV